MKTEELEKLASLSRIKLSEEELKSFHKDIASIIDFVSQVQEISGEEVKGGGALGIYGVLENKFREDENPHEGGIFSEDILNNAPQKEGRYFKVKKIL